MLEPKALNPRELTAERAKHEAFVKYASNPFHGIPNGIREKHEAHLRSIDARQAQLDAQAKKRGEQCDEFVKALKGAGVKLSAADEQKIRTAYDAYLQRHRVKPEITREKNGLSLKQMEANREAHLAILDDIAHSPAAAAGYAASLLHEDDLESTRVRVGAAKTLGTLFEISAGMSTERAEGNNLPIPTSHEPR